MHCRGGAIMRCMFKKLALLLLTLVVLTACGTPPAVETAAVTAAPLATVTAAVAAPAETTTPPPTATALPSPTALAPESPAAAQPEPPTPVPAPTEDAAPTATVTEPSIQVVSGRTPEGAFFLGDERAQLTIIDYADFL